MFKTEVVKLMKLERNIGKFSYIKWVIDELGEWDLLGSKEDNTLEISFKTRMNPYVLCDIIEKYFRIVYDEECEPIIDFEIISDERFYVHIAITGEVL